MQCGADRRGRLTARAEGFARAAATQLGLTGRGYDRLLRVARTVADLAGSDEIREAHLAEAVTFRPAGSA